MLRVALEKHFRNKNVDFQWARIFYMYGKGQAPNSLYSQIQDTIANSKAEFNMSNGDQIRDFLPVSLVAAKLKDLVLDKNKTGISHI